MKRIYHAWTWNPPQWEARQSKLYLNYMSLLEWKPRKAFNYRIDLQGVDITVLPLYCMLLLQFAFQTGNVEWYRTAGEQLYIFLQRYALFVGKTDIHKTFYFLSNVSFLFFCQWSLFACRPMRSFFSFFFLFFSPEFAKPKLWARREFDKRTKL